MIHERGDGNGEELCGGEPGKQLALSCALARREYVWTVLSRERKQRVRNGDRAIGEAPAHAGGRIGIRAADDQLERQSRRVHLRVGAGERSVGAREFKFGLGDVALRHVAGAITRRTGGENLCEHSALLTSNVAHGLREEHVSKCLAHCEDDQATRVEFIGTRSAQGASRRVCAVEALRPDVERYGHGILPW